MLSYLVSLGIGNSLLYALKQLYLTTNCFINFNNHKSDEFEIFSGIRQVSVSSVHLFIAYIDKLIIFMKSKYLDEPIIANIHTHI